MVMAKYPIFLELSGQHVVVIGGGKVAFRKAKVLLETGARVVVVARKAGETMEALCAGSNIRLVKDSYAKEYLVGAVLAIAATDDMALNQQIHKDCQELEVLCNVVDEPALCDFYVPAVVQRGALQIAIGTGGQSPAFAGHLRKKLERIITAEHGEFLEELERLRKRIQAEIGDINERKSLAGELVDDKSFERFVESGAAEWRRWANELVRSRKQ